MPPRFDKTDNKRSKIFVKKKSGFNSINTDTALNLGQFWHKKDVKTSSFILYIIEFTFLDNIDANSIFKQLWNYL